MKPKKTKLPARVKAKRSAAKDKPPTKAQYRRTLAVRIAVLESLRDDLNERIAFAEQLLRDLNAPKRGRKVAKKVKKARAKKRRR